MAKEWGGLVVVMPVEEGSSQPGKEICEALQTLNTSILSSLKNKLSCLTGRKLF